MRTRQFTSDKLVSLLQERKMATMDEMKRALGTAVDLTVFRRLREIKYCSSYSDSGRYYALRSVARFDERGLWKYQDVHFSKHGSLVQTAEQVISASARGFTASELDSELGVETKGALLTLFRRGRLARNTVEGVYVYCATDPEKRREQLFARALALGLSPFAKSAAATEKTGDETRAAIVLFFSTLDERQRRLYAGLESMRLGRGGDRRISDLTGMDVHTIARGRQELLSGKVDTGRLRRPGAGRRPVEKKRQP